MSAPPVSPRLRRARGHWRRALLVRAGTSQYFGHRPRSRACPGPGHAEPPSPHRRPSPTQARIAPTLQTRLESATNGAGDRSLHRPPQGSVGRGGHPSSAFHATSAAWARRSPANQTYLPRHRRPATVPCRYTVPCIRYLQRARSRRAPAVLQRLRPVPPPQAAAQGPSPLAPALSNEASKAAPRHPPAESGGRRALPTCRLLRLSFPPPPPPHPPPRSLRLGRFQAPPAAAHGKAPIPGHECLRLGP
ncbi:hypothetical protein CDD83_6977 [Cordyceps sp. RAO-2017]|nr:hypothetical protein CDD83_6977 [Cordyceps sp. RAO-2017]